MCIRWLPLVLLCIADAHGAEPKRDCYGDPLPEGAIARLGSLCLRNDEIISTAAFTAEGKTLVTASGSSLSFWDPITGKSLRRLNLKNAPRPLQLRCLSADGKTLIQAHPASPNNVISIVDAGNGTQRCTLNHAGGGYLLTMDLSRDGKVLAVAGRDTIAIFDVPRAKFLHEFKRPPTGPLSPRGVIALTPDGKQMVLPHADGSLHVIETTSGKDLRAVQMPRRPGVPVVPRIQSLTVSPDGRYLAFGGNGTPLTVCELATGKCLHQLASTRSHHLAFTPNGQVLAATEGNTIRLFDVPSGKELRTLSMPAGGFNRVLFSPDGRTLAVANAYTLRLWDRTAKRWRHPALGHDGVIHSMVFFPDGKRLVSADSSTGMKVWAIPSGQPLAGHATTPTGSPLVDGDGKWVRFALFNSAHRWDPLTGREEAQPRVEVGLSTNGLALSPDGRSLAVKGYKTSRTQRKPALSYELRLFDLKSGKFVALPGVPPPGQVSQMLFSPDSRRLAARGHDSATRVWDRDSGKLVREFEREGPPTPMHLSLAFATDGRSLLIGSSNRVRICEIAGSADRFHLPSVPRALNALAYAPDGRFVACGEKDGRIRIYSILSGKQLAQWHGQQGSVDSLAFSRDGHLLASGGANGTILIWRVPQEESLPGVRNPEEAVASWQTLGSTDAAAAYRAMVGLTAAPEQALSLFKERLHPLAKSLDQSRFARRVTALDDESFKVRERASRELARAGNDAGDALRQALNKNPSAESKKRMEDLLARLEKSSNYSRRLHFLRAIEILERLGTPQAKGLLRDLASQPLSDEPREEVQASLRRLGDKP